jgi:hypothetical protein
MSDSYKVDKSYWQKQLHYPDWYSRLEEELNELIFPIVHKNPKVKSFRHEVYELVEEMLERNEIPLATTGPNLDTARKPIDAVIIHHTEEEPDIRLSKLSAIGFVRQYGAMYLKNDVLEHKLRGQPIWSGHFLDGKMVFFAYHWLIRPDGTAERLLKEKYLSLQSGDWEINTRSVAIALSGDYEESTPPKLQIAGTAEVIKKNYPFVDKDKVLGHREINPERTCPGAFFLSGWKNILLEFI